MTETFDARTRAFLEEGTRTGKVAYRAADGRPLVTPIWFVLDGDEIVFTTGARSAKAASIRRDPRVSMCVDLEQDPYAFVQIQATAEVSHDLDALSRLATRIAERYVGPERAEEIGRRNAVLDEWIVRLRVQKVIAQFDMLA